MPRKPRRPSGRRPRPKRASAELLSKAVGKAQEALQLLRGKHLTTEFKRKRKTYLREFMSFLLLCERKKSIPEAEANYMIYIANNVLERGRKS